jgi:histidyl-tRNA synthetase
VPSGATSIASDIETAVVIHDLMRAVGFSKFTIRVNHRKVLNGFLENVGLAARATEVLRSLDKLGKIGPAKVAQEMIDTAGATSEQASQVLKLAELSGPNERVLAELAPLVGGNELGQEGVERLCQILEGFRAAGASPDRFALDVSIARGLDYYTDVVFETFLDELPTIGSVCSGGRYDDLASVYTKQRLPGIGASLGLDRLLAAMVELGMIEQVRTPADVFVAYFDKDRLHDYLHLAAQVRAAGIGVEVYPEPKRLGQQLQYADRRGFRVALVAGENELAENKCQVKDMRTGRRHDVPLDNDAESLIAAIRRVLAGGD